MNMEQINKNEISNSANKIGKFIIIVSFINIFCRIFLNNALVNFLHNLGPLNKIDPIEIAMIVRSTQFKIASISIALIIFKVNIKDVFSNKDSIYKLSLKCKTKLTLLFISIGLIGAIPSMFIMMTYDKHIMNIPMAETSYLMSIFGINVAPISEEFLYRGIILNQLKESGYLFSIVISSIYFGVMHGIGFLHAFIIGLILGFAFTLTGNIIWPIIIHFIYNLTTDLIGYLFLPLLPHMSYIVVSLIMGTLLLVIFLTTTLKDKEIKELYEKINIRNIINQFKKDKEKYMVFADEPNIMISIIGWFLIHVMGLISTVFLR